MRFSERQLNSNFEFNKIYAFKYIQMKVQKIDYFTYEILFSIT